MSAIELLEKLSEKYYGDAHSEIIGAIAEVKAKDEELISTLDALNNEKQQKYLYQGRSERIAIQLKAKNEEIAKYQMAIDKQSKRAEALKQLSLDKDEEIKKLKAEKESLCKTIKDLQTANTHWRIYHKDNQ